MGTRCWDQNHQCSAGSTRDPEKFRFLGLFLVSFILLILFYPAMSNSRWMKMFRLLQLQMFCSLSLFGSGSPSRTGSSILENGPDDIWIPSTASQAPSLKTHIETHTFVLLTSWGLYIDFHVFPAHLTHQPCFPQREPGFCPYKEQRFLSRLCVVGKWSKIIPIR